MTTQEYRIHDYDAIDYILLPALYPIYNRMMRNSVPL